MEQVQIEDSGETPLWFHYYEPEDVPPKSRRDSRRRREYHRINHLRDACTGPYPTQFVVFLEWSTQPMDDRMTVIISVEGTFNVPFRTDDTID